MNSQMVAPGTSEGAGGGGAGGVGRGECAGDTAREGRPGRWGWRRVKVKRQQHCGSTGAACVDVTDGRFPGYC